MWGHRAYTLFGILLIAFVLLTIVTSFIVIALTYFQLAYEDYRWWWRSFVSGGMIGVFILAYGVFYYYTVSEMSGFFQSAFFFGYLAIIALAFFLMFGAVGFMSAFTFVDYIYANSKSD